LPASGRAAFIASAVLVRRVKGRIVIQAMIPPGGGLGGGLDNPNHGCRTVVHSNGYLECLQDSPCKAPGTMCLPTWNDSDEGEIVSCSCRRLDLYDGDDKIRMLPMDEGGD
jgi:hypothetical protein